jgi:hypothetical protein
VTTPLLDVLSLFLTATVLTVGVVGLARAPERKRR